MCRPYLFSHPGQVLAVMANVVRDELGLSEATGRPEALVQLTEEFSVEVDALVGRAIKRVPSLTARRRTPTVPRWHKKASLGRV